MKTLREMMDLVESAQKPGAWPSGPTQKDMTGQTCEKCKKGEYQETGYHDDMDGVLHCTKCGTRVDRWRKYKESGVAEGSDQELVKRQGSYWDQVAKEKKNKEREALKAKKAEYEKTPVGKAEKYWSQKGVAEDQIEEASPEAIARITKLSQQ